MKTIVCLLLLCASMAGMGQDFDVVYPVIRGGVQEIGVSTANIGSIARDSLLSWWDQYKAEADSVHREWKIQTAASDTLLPWIPVRPTFEGFMEYLRRKQTTERGK